MSASENYQTTVHTNQPTFTNMGVAPGSDPRITIRTLRDDAEDAEFAARLMVEAFRGKMVHAVGEQK